jgi:hypothetical protein
VTRGARRPPRARAPPAGLDQLALAKVDAVLQGFQWLHRQARLAQPPSVPGVRRRSGAARAKGSNGKGLKWQVQHRLPELAAPEAPAAFGALYARRRLELIFLRCTPSPLRT